MFEDFLNAASLTCLVAILSTAMLAEMHSTRPRPEVHMPVVAAAVAADQPDPVDLITMVYGADAGVPAVAEASAPIVQLPMVVVTGHRTPPPTAFAAAE